MSLPDVNLAMTQSQGDLVRGIRNNKDREAHYINQAIQEIKQELHQQDFDIKANALDKLIYVWLLLTVVDSLSYRCLATLWTLLLFVLLN